MNEFVRASRAPEVTEGFAIHGEIAHGGSVFRSHIGDRRPVRQGELGGAGAVELDKLPDHFVLAKDLGDRERQIGGRGGGGQFPGKIKTDHFGGQEGQGLAQHASLGLNASHAPSDDAEPVDHGGVGVRADEGIRVSEDGAVGLFLGEDTPGEVFEIHLMDNADARRNHAESFKGLLAPL